MFPLYLYKQGALLATYGGAVVVPPPGWSAPPADLQPKSAFRPRQQMFPQPALFRPLLAAVAAAEAGASTAMAAKSDVAGAGLSAAGGTPAVAAAAAGVAPHPSQVSGEGCGEKGGTAAMTLPPTPDAVGRAALQRRDGPVSSAGGLAPVAVVGVPVEAAVEAGPSPDGRQAPARPAVPVDVGDPVGTGHSRPALVAPLPSRSPVAGPLAAAPSPRTLNRSGGTAADGDTRMVDDSGPDGVAVGGSAAADASEADESEEEMPLDRFERFQASLKRDASGQLIVCSADAMDAAPDGGNAGHNTGRGGGRDDPTAVGGLVGGHGAREVGPPMTGSPGDAGLQAIVAGGVSPSVGVGGSVSTPVGAGSALVDDVAATAVAVAAASKAASAAATTLAAAAAASLASAGFCNRASRSPTPDASSSGSPVEVRRSSVPVRRKRRLPSHARDGRSSSDVTVEPLTLDLTAIHPVASTAPASVAAEAAVDATAAGRVAFAGVGAADAGPEGTDANDADAEDADRDGGPSSVGVTSVAVASSVGGGATPMVEATGEEPYPFGLPRPILVRTKAGEILKPSRAPMYLPYCDVKFGRVRPGVPFHVSAVLSMARVGLRLEGGKVVSITAPDTPADDPVVASALAGKRVATRAAARGPAGARMRPLTGGRTRPTTGGRTRASSLSAPPAGPLGAPPAELLVGPVTGYSAASPPGAARDASRAPAHPAVPISSRAANLAVSPCASSSPAAAATSSASLGATAAPARALRPRRATREACALKVSPAAKVTKPGARVAPLDMAIQAAVKIFSPAPPRPPTPPPTQLSTAVPTVAVEPDAGNDGSPAVPLLSSIPALPSPSLPPPPPPSSSPLSQALPPRRSNNRKRSVTASPAPSAGPLALATLDGDAGGAQRRASGGATAKRPRVSATAAPPAGRRVRSQAASPTPAPAARRPAAAALSQRARQRERRFAAQMAAAKIPSFEISSSSVTLFRFERRVRASAAQLRRRLPPDADLEEWFWDLLHGGAPPLPPYPVVAGGAGGPPTGAASASASASGGTQQAPYFGPGAGADPRVPRPSRERSYLALYGVDVEVSPNCRRRAPPPCVPAGGATARAKAAALESRSRSRAFSDDEDERGDRPAETVAGDRNFQDVWADSPTPSALNGAAAVVDVGDVAVTRSWHAGNVNVGSALRHTAVMPGISSSMFYVGSLYSRFCWHVEDSLLNSLSYLHSGEPKIWYIVPPHQRRRLEAALAEVIAPRVLEEDGDSAAAVLRHKTIMADVRWVASQAGIEVRRAEHRPGTFVALAPGSYHSGFNMGVNKAEAVNFAAPDWFRVGVESAEEARGSQVSFAFPVECVIIAEAESLAYGAGSPGTVPQMRAAAGAARFATDVGFIGDTVAAIAKEVRDFLSPSPTTTSSTRGGVTTHPAVAPGRVLLAEAPRKVVDFLATAGIPGGRARDGAVCHTCGYVTWAAVVVCAGCVDQLADEVCGVRCLRCASDVCAAGAWGAGGVGGGGGRAEAPADGASAAAAAAAAAAIFRDSAGGLDGDGSSDGESETLGEGDASVPTLAAQGGAPVGASAEGKAAAASVAMVVELPPSREGGGVDTGSGSGGGCGGGAVTAAVTAPGPHGAAGAAGAAARAGAAPVRRGSADVESDCEVLFEGDADCPGGLTAMHAAASPPVLPPPLPLVPASSPPMRAAGPGRAVQAAAAGRGGGDGNGGVIATAAMPSPLPPPPPSDTPAGGSGDESETLCEGRVSRSQSAGVGVAVAPPPPHAAGLAAAAAAAGATTLAAGAAGGGGSGDESETLCEGLVSLPAGGAGAGGRGRSRSDGGTGGGGASGGGASGAAAAAAPRPVPAARAGGRSRPPPGGIRRPKAVPHAPLVVLREPVEWLTHIAAAVRAVAAGGAPLAGAAAEPGATDGGGVAEAVPVPASAGDGRRDAATAADAAGAAAAPPVLATACVLPLGGGGGVPASGSGAPRGTATAPHASPAARVGP